MKFGRIDVAQSLKQLLELTAGYSPELGEGIVPTVQLYDLERSPFHPDIPWSCGLPQVAGTIGNYTWFGIEQAVSPTAFPNFFITVDEIYISGAAVAGGTDVWIQPDTGANIPGGGGLAAPRAHDQGGQANTRRIPYVLFSAGNFAQGPANEGILVNAPADGSTLIVTGKWTIRSGGGLGVVTRNLAGVAAPPLNVSFVGRVHLSTTR